MRLFLNSILHMFRVIDYTICLYSAPSGHDGAEPPFNRISEFFFYFFRNLERPPGGDIALSQSFVFHDVIKI
jgi:hypothetical protein